VKDDVSSAECERESEIYRKGFEKRSSEERWCYNSKSKSSRCCEYEGDVRTARQVLEETDTPCRICCSHLSKRTNKFPKEQNEHLAIYLGVAGSRFW
jgi:hypothetical protein